MHMITTTYINRNYLLRVQPLKGASFLIGATRFMCLFSTYEEMFVVLSLAEYRLSKSRKNRVSVRVGNLYINFIAR